MVVPLVVVELLLVPLVLLVLLPWSAAPCDDGSTPWLLTDWVVDAGGAEWREEGEEVEAEKRNLGCECRNEAPEPMQPRSTAATVHVPAGIWSS